MSRRRRSGSSCGVFVLLIILVIGAILVYRAGLMPPQGVQLLDTIAKQLQPIGDKLEPIAKQLEPIGKQLETMARSFTETAQSPTPVPKP